MGKSVTGQKQGLGMNSPGTIRNTSMKKMLSPAWINCRAITNSQPYHSTETWEPDVCYPDTAKSGFPGMKIGLKQDPGLMKDQHLPFPFGEKYLFQQVASMSSMLLENVF